MNEMCVSLVPVLAERSRERADFSRSLLLKNWIRKHPLSVFFALSIVGGDLEHGGAGEDGGEHELLGGRHRLLLHHLGNNGGLVPGLGIIR